MARIRVALVVVGALAATGCATGPVGVASSSAAPDAGSTGSGSSSLAPCGQRVVAIDPGHNPVRIESFDPVTGAAQIDYPNGAEDRNVFSVAQQVQRTLTARGYRVVLLKRSPGESVSYRERVTRAERAGAALAVSIHTSPGVNAVFPQRVGLYRSGAGRGGKPVRIVFTNAATAAASQRYSAAIAAARSKAEGHRVSVRDNNFGGRAPLWAGNIPIISLIATNTPWVYNEFGPAGGTGGSIPVPATALSKYARGIATGIEAALPTRCM
ncbi:N-acetylmuramoyl-L-alanine amidase [Gordonia sp. X0973]|uniref:N-acetylmuramoyl-L-alanine amidase family protein n=1 Tax=Gordonia sp. X0973 TaxID=2742602 RepID=UPI0026575EB2|nr:N-acetylmuramoyl-L-alanine amidase [Gordonia sp. X0973]